MTTPRRKAHRGAIASRALCAGALLLTLTADAPLAAQASPAATSRASDWRARIDSLATAAIANGPLAGLAVGVMRGGEVLYAKGYGFSDLEHRVPVNVETNFRLGSLTKQFTALAVLQLAEQGKLSLADDLSKYLPDYPMRGRRIPIWMLLSHLSGIKNYTELNPAFWADSFRIDLPHERLVAMFKNAPDDFAPGTDFHYTNSGFFLAGMIVEKVSGESYAEYLQRHVFEPNGLSATSYCDDEAIVPNRAKGYQAGEAGLENAPPLSMTVPYAAGALCSNVVDLLRYQRALNTGRIVSRASLQRMTTPVLMKDGWRTGYGFGLAVDDDFVSGERMIGHGGQINGFWTSLNYYPAHDLTVVVLSNVNPAPGEDLWSISARMGLVAMGKSPAPVPTPVPISAAALQRYAGKYRAMGEPFEFAVENGVLVLKGAAPTPLPLVYTGRHVFRLPGAILFRAEFEPGPSGRVDGLRLKIPQIPLTLRGRREG